MFKKILVGLDGSDSSLIALDYAVHLAKHDKAELLLVTAVEPLPPLTYYPGGTPTYMPQFMDEMFSGMKKMQEDHLERLKKAYPDMKISGKVKEGRAAHVIKTTVEDSDLIVIGHRGMGGLLSWVLGSVAKEVVDDCTVPVLVVKDKNYC